MESPKKGFNTSIVRTGKDSQIVTLNVSGSDFSGNDNGKILLWDRQTGSYLKTLQIDGPYERMNIKGVTGVTEAQRASLQELGAVEK